jgi:hypothetical protein
MYMAVGTAYYFCYPFAVLDVSYLLVTAFGAREMHYVKDVVFDKLPELVGALLC